MDSSMAGSDCGKVGAPGEKQMKTITIRLPDVEAAMLVEVQKKDKAFRNIQLMVMQNIRKAYFE